MVPKTAPTPHSATQESLRFGLFTSVFHTFEECGIPVIHHRPVHVAMEHCLERLKEEGQDVAMFGLRKDPVTKDFPELNLFIQEALRKGRLQAKRISSGIPGTPMIEIYCIADGFYADVLKVNQSAIFDAGLLSAFRKVSGCVIKRYSQYLAKRAPRTDIVLVSTKTRPLVFVPRQPSHSLV